MHQYLSNLIPRLREISDTLNRREQFVNKTWLLLQESNAFVEFTFERRFVYKSIQGGQAIRGDWKILSSTDQVWINFSNSESYLLKQLFVSSKVMILIDNSGSRIFPFVNTLSEIRTHIQLQEFLYSCLENPKQINDSPRKSDYLPKPLPDLTWDELIVYISITIGLLMFFIFVMR